MRAYMIFIRDKTLDECELATYAKEVPETLMGHEANPLALFGSHEDHEGPPTEGVAILEFPTIRAAKAWYESPVYRKVREHRLHGGIYRVNLVEGV